MQENATTAPPQDATEVLIELHEQLIRYKTAVESIDGAAASTQQAADAIAAIASKLDGLREIEGRVEASLQGTLESLQYIQNGAEATQHELNRIVDEFANRLNAVIQNRQGVSEIDGQIGEALLVRNDELGQEVRRLRMFSITNTLLVVILFFWLVFGNMPAAPDEETGRPEAAQAIPETERPRENPPPVQQAVVEALNVQILNGCGIRGAAKQVEDALAQHGISVQARGNADHFKYEATQVFAGDDNKAEAERIAAILGLPNPANAVSLSQWGDFHLTIVIGKDFPQWAEALR